MEQIGIMLLTEAARDWETTERKVETPLAPFDGVALRYPVVFAPILRAGLGLLTGMQRLLPGAKVGHIGLFRDEATLLPVDYYLRLPPDLVRAQVLLLDPMLATGHSAARGTLQLKEHGAQRIQLLCAVASAQGVAHFHQSHPDVTIYCAALDRELNHRGYIVPGLGDAGDRYFGT